MKISQDQPQTRSQQRKLSKMRMRKPRKTQWTIAQQILYVDYLKKNSQLMKSQRSRRANQVFKKISMLVGTRTCVQVKTHHQKLEQKYQNTSNIIYHLQLLIKKNAAIEAQRQEEEAERARDEASSTSVAIEQKNIAQEEGKAEPINAEIVQAPFFEYQSKNYELLSWQFAIDCNQPLL